MVYCQRQKEGKQVFYGLQGGAMEQEETHSDVSREGTKIGFKL